MADLETNDDTTANDAFDAIAKQSEAAESKAIETGTYNLIDDRPIGSYDFYEMNKGLWWSKMVYSSYFIRDLF